MHLLLRWQRRADRICRGEKVPPNVGEARHPSVISSYTLTFHSLAFIAAVPVGAAADPLTTESAASCVEWVGRTDCIAVDNRRAMPLIPPPQQDLVRT